MKCLLPRLLLSLTMLAALPAPILAQDPALRGLDPVLLTQGKEVAGLPDLVVQQGQYSYLFASDANRTTFLGDPRRYEIQFGGGCGRMGPLSGAGDSDRFAVHGERIYVFASDQCRTSFLKKPELFFDPDDAAPKPTAEQAARGQELLRAALAAHGGADRLAALRTYRHERTVVKGDTTEQFRVQVGFPASLRRDHDYLQHDKQWRYAQVLTADDAFFVNQGKPADMHPTARREAERLSRREPLLALRAALDGKHVVSGIGKAKVGDLAVEQLVLWRDGCATTFGLGDDGRIRTATFRGRSPQLWFGEIALTFDDYREVAGVIVPSTVRGTVDGKPSPGLDELREHVEVDAPLAEGLFARPR